MNAGGTDLLEAVYAAPDDDGRRLVYADWLQEHGDPRGELIVLQFERRTREPSAKAIARERSLLKKHRGEWLGPVWDLVYRVPFRGADRDYDLAFERGFLEQGVTNFRDGKLEKATGDPRWTTVRTLMVSDSLFQADRSLWPEARAFYLHDVFRWLVVIEHAHPEIAIALLRDPRPRRLRTLRVACDLGSPPWSDRLRAAIVEGSGLPDLRQLGLETHDQTVLPGDYDWLWTTPVGAKLEALHLTCFGGTPSGWPGMSLEEVTRAPEIQAWTRADATPPSLTNVRFAAGERIVDLERLGTEWRVASRSRV